MFERRLKILLILMAVPTAILVARLVQLQVLQAGLYRDESESLLVCRERFFPCLRGDITDAQGRRLASDAPSWDISVDYRAMAGDEDYFRELARDRLNARELPCSRTNIRREVEALHRLIEPSWLIISVLTETPLADLYKTRDRIVRRVKRIHESVSARRGVDTPVKEEFRSHPVVRSIDRDTQIEARIQLADYPWVEIVASHARLYSGGPAIGHLLGRLGEVSEQQMDDDPRADDELACYQLGDFCGITGLERLGEECLRGSRGHEQKNLRGENIILPVAPQDGGGMRLTIDLPLQQAIYDRLLAAVQSCPASTGGSAVMIDIPSRHVLALVSYPGLDPNISEFDRIQAAENDPIGQPHIFRAVGRFYSPGSTVKPFILAGGLSDGKLTRETRINCTGVLEGYQRPRNCLSRHGLIDPITAIQKSCNIFFYEVGQRIGVAGLVDWFQLFGLGRETGTGLNEEQRGHLPTGQSNGIARLAAIGQGELDLTPIQAANAAATIASGVYRPVTLWMDDPAPKPAVRLPVSDADWQVVREGMYRVVNQPGGTAFGPHRATLDFTSEYVLLGKTGSAQTRKRPFEWVYVCHFPDGEVKEVVAKSKRQVVEQYPTATIAGSRATRYWPLDQSDPTDAWFIGYLTSKNHYLDSSNGHDLHVAIAVVVEYGGHGGETAAPVARSMIQSLMLRHQGNNPNGGAGGGQ